VNVTIGVLIMGTVVGCSNAPGVTEISRCLSEKPPHSLSVSNREVENLRVNQKGENQWQVTFDCREDALAPWVIPSSIESDLASLEERVQAVDASRSQLRRPELKKVEAIRKKIEGYIFPKSFVVITDDDSSVVWNCEGIYTPGGDGGNLTLTKIACQNNTPFQDLRELTQMSPNLSILDGSAADPLVKYIALVQEYEGKIESLKRSMQERLAEEKRRLEEFVSANTCYAAVVEASTALIYAESLSDRDFVSGVIVDPQDTFSRCVFRGELQLVDSNAHDGWILSFDNADPNLCAFSRKFRNPITFAYDTELGEYQAFSAGKLSKLEPSDHTIPVVKIGSDRFRVGTTFEGLELVPGKASQSFTATVTYWNPVEHSARLITEVPSKPHMFSVFQGTLNFDAPHHLGLPMKFQRVAGGMHGNSRSDGTQLFRYSTKEPLYIIVGEGEKSLGKIGTAEIRLQATPSSESSIELAEDRWMTALRPGVVWEGTSKWRSEASQEVRLVVAENRNNGQYVRLMLEKESNPTQFVVIEGAIQSGVQADAYGFLGFQKGTATYNDTGEYYGVLFSRWEDENAKSTRLTPNGQLLHIITKSGESATLTRSQDTFPVDSLTTDSFQVAWTKALELGKTWNGTIVNESQNQKAEVVLSVTAFERMGDEVQLDIRLKGMRSGGASYSGSLTRTDDAINGFALTVKKVKGGAGSSTILGSNWSDVQIQFRLTPDSKSLVGRALSYGDFEYLVLEE